jgi:tetratricopeptide (TPR) repeat protein
VARGESREKVIERATALAQRGAIGRAIAALEEYLAAQPDDDRILVRLADLRRRVNDDAGAAEAFSKAAAVYAARGFSAKVAAVLQQALALSPDDPSMLERLAAAKMELNLPREATQLLERLADAATKAGDPQRVLGFRRRIHELLPLDAASSVRLADALVETGARDEAIALLEKAAEPLTDPAKQELWILLQDRLADLLPDDHARAKELGRVLLAHGAPKRALARLKPLVTADPDDVEALELLAKAFDALGQGEKVVAAWRSIAKAHLRAGRPVESEAAWLHVRELAPADPEAAAALPKPELPPRSPTATLAEDLAEADFFETQGLVDEARAILERLRTIYPDEQVVAERLEELEVEKVAVSELILDEEELSDGTEAARESTTDVLARAAAAPTPSATEAATHRDLAAAFLEMERYDDALAEVEKALVVDPASAGASHLVGGRCHLASGAPRKAIEEYHRARESRGLSFEDAADVLCELGHSYELLGEREEALRCFEEAKRLEPSLEGEERLLEGGMGAR